MILEALLFLMTAIFALAVVLTREPKQQALVLSFYGLVLTLLFLVLQAPDVAYSEIVVGAAIIPLMLLIAISKLQRKPPGEPR